MLISFKKLFRKITPPLAGLFFIYLSFYYTSEGERNEIYRSLKDAKIEYIFISISLGIISFLSRAYRWKYMLNAMGYYPKFFNNVLAVFVAYLANLGIPRSGEILRATVMQTYESIPFNKAFGTILAERLIDLIMLFSLILLCLFLETDVLLPFIIGKINSYLNKHHLLLIILAFSSFILIIIRVFKERVLKKISVLVKGISIGFTTILKMNNKIYYVTHTILIWTIYILVFYIMKFSLNGTELLEFRTLLVSFIFGAISITTTNGGIGVYPLSISVALSFYSIPLETSLAFGWITWSIQTLVILFFGILSFFLLPIVNNKV
ncbi:MAG: TIGR00374 family protein [Flavobacteriaceae bacterium]|nr:TIGR00374 family protein [Flavobacteriaceae bacterium]|tara:strand:+ start:2637 stop:3602 length:966 start_codon:yes stop_codon:yes gene_type:complete